MMAKLLSALTFIIFSASFFTQAVISFDTSLENKKSVVAQEQSVKHNLTASKSEPKQDCTHNECEEQQEAHCSHHCSALSHMALFSLSTNLIQPEDLGSKALYYLSTQYKMPFLDPALRPPTHS